MYVYIYIYIYIYIFFKLLKPIDSTLLSTRFKIQKLCQHCFFVFYRFQNKKTDFLLIRHEQVVFFYITEVESVYCAVRTESLYKKDKVRL